MLNLKNESVRNALSKQILKDIDDFCIKHYDDGNRNHLGASLIGHECLRFLWYGFRWFQKEKPSGRLGRLFNRGHREEERFVEWLRGIGFSVWEFQTDGKTQLRITGVKNHYGGSLDGIAKLPETYQFEKPMLLEFKTANEKQFKKLKKEGVKVAKIMHFEQMCNYGKQYNLKYALYFCINKNDDEIYIEVVELDWFVANGSIKTAEYIINATEPPVRLDDNPSYWKCKCCDFRKVCHFEEKPLKNCRTCVFSKPVENGKWKCTQPSQPFCEINNEIEKTGCDLWESIV